jgi:hypothetical protein
MKLAQRKFLYVVLGLGAVASFSVALIGFVLSLGRIDTMFLQSVGGLIGVVSGLFAIVRLPIASWITRIVLTFGIAAGCAAAVSFLLVDVYSSPSDLDRSVLHHLGALYVFGGPILVGLALLAEFWWPRSAP